MPSDHVGFETMIIERTLDGEICGEHGRLGVFGLFQFVLCLGLFLFGKVRPKDKAGEGFTIENFSHRFIGLSPHLLNCSITLVEVMRHTDVLTALTGVHVGDFCFRMKGCVLGDQNPLCLQKAPLFFIAHGFCSQNATLGEFSP